MFSDPWQSILVLCEWLLVGAVLLSLTRIFRGPTIYDRILSVELIAVSVMSSLALISVEYRLVVLFDLLLLWVLIAFIGTVALGSALSWRRP